MSRKSLTPPHGMYIPDFYIPALNCWIEVKGYEREVGIAKFRHFAESHNAILWNKRLMEQIYPQLAGVAGHTDEEIEENVLPFPVESIQDILLRVDTR